MTLGRRIVVLLCASWRVPLVAGFSRFKLSRGISAQLTPRCQSGAISLLSMSPSLDGGGSTEARLLALEQLCATQAAEMTSLRNELDDLREEQAKAAKKLDTWAEELGEMCTMIAYQLDRANSVEQAATSGEPLVEPLPTANSQDASPSSSTTSSGKMVSNNSQSDARGGNSATSRGSSKRPLPPASCRAMFTAAEDGIRIGDAGAKGLGAFADRDFDADVTVGDYQGEWMSVRDLDARYPHTCAPLAPGAPPRPPPTMVDVQWRESRLQRGVGLSGDYIFGVGDGIFVDGEDVEASNWGRFVNHAPETNPACNLRCKTLTQDRTGRPRVWFVSTRSIAAGEELLFDYGDNYWDDPEEVKGFGDDDEEGNVEGDGSDEGMQENEAEGTADEGTAAYMKYSDDPAQNWAL